MKVLVFLQNAYGVEDGYVPTYERESFASCHTGKRLKEMIPDDAEIIIRNSSPQIGDVVSSNIPPDWEYIAGQIEMIDHDVILACGKNAREGVSKALSFAAYRPRVVYAPHPAWRQLSKQGTTEIRTRIMEV